MKGFKADHHSLFTWFQSETMSSDYNYMGHCIYQNDSINHSYQGLGLLFVFENVHRSKFIHCIFRVRAGATLSNSYCYAFYKAISGDLT